jgi:2-dehydro-3-deoxyphosphooctonate aldolase (KDO 8-P synthase)
MSTIHGGRDVSTPNPVKVGHVEIGRHRPLALIAGPCVMEPGEMTLTIARRLVEICGELGVPLVFKASFDKANRTSGSSYRGPGLVEGMKVFGRIKADTGLPVTTDIHETVQAGPLAEMVDLLQVPAFLARQTDLLEAAAATGRPVNVKKGQFMGPGDMANVVAKLAESRAAGVILTERGSTFGYGRLVNDFRSIPQMQATGAPVVFDATHSVQLPGGGPGGTASSGQREMIPTLARAAVAAGCDALFIEVHPDPDRALSDGPNSLRLDDLKGLLTTCLRIRAAIWAEL